MVATRWQRLPRWENDWCRGVIESVWMLRSWRDLRLRIGFVYQRRKNPFLLLSVLPLQRRLCCFVRSGVAEGSSVASKSICVTISAAGVPFGWRVWSQLPPSSLCLIAEYILEAAANMTEWYHFKGEDIKGAHRCLITLGNSFPFPLSSLGCFYFFTKAQVCQVESGTNYQISGCSVLCLRCPSFTL